MPQLEQLLMSSIAKHIERELHVGGCWNFKLHEWTLANPPKDDCRNVNPKKIQCPNYSGFWILIYYQCKIYINKNLQIKKY
jgi:hypothetical protein